MITLPNRVITAYRSPSDSDQSILPVSILLESLTLICEYGDITQAKDTSTESKWFVDEDAEPPTGVTSLQEVQESSDEEPLIFRRFTSRHSSRSSSFNDSAAEVILGLFQLDQVDQRFADEEDPAVRERFIYAEAQNPESWVSKRLARSDLWADSESEDDTQDEKQDDSESMKQSAGKRKRSPIGDLEERTSVEPQSKRLNTTQGGSN